MRRQAAITSVWLRWAAVVLLLALAVVEVITTRSPWAWLLLALPVGVAVYLLRERGQQ